MTDEYEYIDQGNWTCWDESPIALSPDMKSLVTGEGDGTTRIWDAATKQCRHGLDGPLSSRIVLARFSADGTTLASSSADGRVSLWNTATGACEKVLRGHLFSAYSISFSPYGNILATGSKADTVRIWDTTNCSWSRRGQRCMRHRILSFRLIVHSKSSFFKKSDMV